MRHLSVVGLCLILALGGTQAFDPLGWIAGKTKEIGKVLEPVTMDGAKANNLK